ncbi:MAG: HEAT repeat domain-containing protein [Planctomycetaceae bacterium]|nr:HEAT repeat domain-containing protein [Planctomycetaceae bacterium]
MTDPRKALREALAQALRQGPDPTTLAALERRARDGVPYGVAGDALGLADPREALPLLQRMLGHENWIVAVEAAATLALLGDRSGLTVLTGPARSATNSNIESFLIHAALLLLGEPVPPPERRSRSVFLDREALIDAACKRS